MEKLTTRWAEYIWQKLPQFWVLASRNTNKWVLELKANVHKTIKMAWVRPLMTNLKMTIKTDCAVSAYSTPVTSVYKGSCPTGWSGGGVGLWIDVCHPNSPVSGIWNQTNFPFHQPDLIIGFDMKSSCSYKYPFGKSGTVLPPIEGKTTRPFWYDLNEIP